MGSSAEDYSKFKANLTSAQKFSDELSVLLDKYRFELKLDPATGGISAKPVKDDLPIKYFVRRAGVHNTEYFNLMRYKNFDS